MPNNKISDFIIDNNWNFPHDWQLWFPFLCNLLPSVPNRNSANVDMLTWIHKENGILILKDAYLSKAPNIKEVLRSPPNPRWKTCNRDRAFNVSSNPAGAGGIFRNHLGDFISSFTKTIEPNSSFLLK